MRRDNVAHVLANELRNWPGKPLGTDIVDIQNLSLVIVHQDGFGDTVEEQAKFCLRLPELPRTLLQEFFHT